MWFFLICISTDEISETWGRWETETCYRNNVSGHANLLTTDDISLLWIFCGLLAHLALRMDEELWNYRSDFSAQKNLKFDLRVAWHTGADTITCFPVVQQCSVVVAVRHRSNAVIEMFAVVISLFLYEKKLHISFIKNMSWNTILS